MSTEQALAEWLSACLREDEQRAKAWEHDNPDDGGYYACPAVHTEPYGDLPWGEENCDCGLAARRGFTLADIAAKRRILERLHHEPYEGLRNSWEYGEVVTEEYVSCSCGWEKVITHGHDWDDLYAAHCDELGVSPTIAEAVLRLLALPYAGRDGWRDEWRPE